MSVYLEIESDPFLGIASREQSYAGGMSKPIRRPLRGIQVKPDSYAWFKIIDKYGQAVPIMDAGGQDDPYNPKKGVSYQYTNFLVQSTQQSSAEKHQVASTFGDDYLFLFGQQPKIYQINGLLMNTFDFTWASEFWYNYENYLRGTKCVESNARIYFYCDGQLWDGYLLSASATKNSKQPHIVPLQLSMFVTGENIVENIGDTDFPLYPGDQGVAKKTKSGLFGQISAGIRAGADMMATATATLETAQSLDFNLLDMKKALTTGDFTLLSGKYKRRGPVRSKIRDNWDEYIGAEIPKTDQPAWWMKMKLSLGFSFGSRVFADLGGHLRMQARSSWGPLLAPGCLFGTGVAGEYGDEP